MKNKNLTLNKKNTFQTCKISEFICTLDPFGNKIAKSPINYFKPYIAMLSEHIFPMT
jgi:hypothetical protein